MKKIITIILVFSFILILLAGCGGSNDSDVGISDNRILKIGVLISSPSETLGIEYANFTTPTVEIEGAVYEIELVFVDNPFTEETSSIAQMFVDQGVSVIISSCESAAEMMADDVFRESGLAVIGISNIGLPDSANYFRMYHPNPFGGQALANFAIEHFDAERAYILANLGDDCGTEFAAYFIEAFDRENVIYEIFPSGISDFTPYILSAKEADAQILFTPVSEKYANLIISQTYSEGLHIPILASDDWRFASLDEALGKNIEIYISTLYKEGGSPQFDTGFRDFVSLSASDSGYDSDIDKITDIIVTGYEAYFAAIQAVASAGSLYPNYVRTVLSHIVFNSIISGDVMFNENNVAKRSLVFIKSFNTQTNEWELITV
ncbi:MAG: ABC transporter substrate-binding protein [Defluviitaleaceae bacterium]|nr:ABC transporter substrate-binding protein [Defluviitaleaceae bacterium]